MLYLATSRVKPVILDILSFTIIGFGLALLITNHELYVDKAQLTDNSRFFLLELRGSGLDM
jgi:hypothetical protein